jgi:hypothetical protein
MVNRDTKTPSMWQTLVNIAKNEGSKGLFQGCAVRTLNLGVSSIVFFLVYEKVKLGLATSFGKLERSEV